MDARELWKRIETIHAVTYFAPESRAAAQAAGLKGFWMGYFGFRAAPLGAVGPGVVEATFANFAPAMVARAVPDVWKHATPDDLIGLRAEASAAALRLAAPSIEQTADVVNNTLGVVVGAGEPIGRPLFAANRAIDPTTRFDDPVARLWQLCSTLREHRGDGHVAILAAHDVSGLQSHLLLMAERGVPSEVVIGNRGWDDDTCAAAEAGLVERGLVERTGGDAPLTLTEPGRVLRSEIETATDALALGPWTTMGPSRATEVFDALDRTAREIQAAEVLPFPNPMGLPALDE